jgi:hypothetical protein
MAGPRESKESRRSRLDADDVEVLNRAPSGTGSKETGWRQGAGDRPLDFWVSGYFRLETVG